MANITIRNIPESVFEKIKFLSEVERRSLNNEMLVVIEMGIMELEKAHRKFRHVIGAETQAALWNELGGQWKDSKSKRQAIREIYDTRSMGREFPL